MEAGFSVSHTLSQGNGVKDCTQGFSSRGVTSIKRWDALNWMSEVPGKLLAWSQVPRVISNMNLILAHGRLIDRPAWMPAEWSALVPDIQLESYIANFTLKIFLSLPELPWNYWVSTRMYPELYSICQNLVRTSHICQNLAGSIPIC